MQLKPFALACAILLLSVGSSWASTASILQKFSEQSRILVEQMPECSATKNPADCTSRLKAANEKVIDFAERVRRIRTMEEWHEIQREACPFADSIDAIWHDYFGLKAEKQPCPIK